MQARPNLFRTAVGAFFLQADTYTDMRDDPRRLSRGLVFVLAFGVLVGAALAWNQFVRWSFSPNLDLLKTTILTHLTQMPWYTQAETNSQFASRFTQFYDLAWNAIKVVAPSPVGLVNLLLQPLGLLIGWVVYGVLAHLFAKLLGGQGSLGQTLGCTALAASAHLLNLIQFVPYAAVAGVGTWALVCNFTALRAAHRFSGWRALVAALAPLVLFALAGLVLGGLGLAVGYLAFNSMGGGR